MRIDSPRPATQPSETPIPERVVLGVHAGGLGDHLAYSALPRLYKKAGAREVLLSSITNYGEPFTRNSEVKKLVWEMNPFVDGFSDDPPNVGEHGWPPVEFFKAAKLSGSPVETTALVHGLSIGNLPQKPDVFYFPRHRADFVGKDVCDPRSSSQGFSSDVFGQFIRYATEWHGIDRDNLIVLESRYSGMHGAASLSECRRHFVSDIFEYADVIASARTFLSTEAGGQSLAAAFRRDRTFVLQSSRAFNERCFCWPTNDYFVTSQMTPKDEEFP